MICVTLRFYGDLNSLLSRNTPKTTTFQRRLPEPPSVKDLIEGCGVPHTEVDLILADGEPVDFSYLIEDGDRISVYPFFNAFDIPPGSASSTKNASPSPFPS